ncbi:MAG: hypothetical protein ABS81_07260 [Pseudonocardia sp. SCN 72-86]|nr:MAG: hypothetical protein ABS81_07260 [Pseudonocardia sp. SCN 72-86]
MIESRPTGQRIDIPTHIIRDLLRISTDDQWTLYSIVPNRHNRIEYRESGCQLLWNGNAVVLKFSKELPAATRV